MKIPFYNWKIYLDTCCLNRSFNDQTQTRIACAESSKVDVFLTTDDRLIRRANRIRALLQVRVENPYTWLQKEIGNERTKDD